MSSWSDAQGTFYISDGQGTLFRSAANGTMTVCVVDNLGELSVPLVTPQRAELQKCML